MPKYRAANALFLGIQYIEPGEEFVSDLPPGRNWEPLDAAAMAACAERDGSRGEINAKAAAFDRKVEAGAVDIPEDWRELHHTKRRSIAQKLGAPGTVNTENADSFIQAELERRAHRAAA